MEQSPEMLDAGDPKTVGLGRLARSSCLARRTESRTNGRQQKGNSKQQQRRPQHKRELREQTRRRNRPSPSRIHGDEGLSAAEDGATRRERVPHASLPGPTPASSLDCGGKAAAQRHPGAIPKAAKEEHGRHKFSADSQG